MGLNVFQNPTSSLPKEPDDQIVRVSMKENEISSRKEQWAKTRDGSDGNKLNLSHVKGA